MSEGIVPSQSPRSAALKIGFISFILRKLEKGFLIDWNVFVYHVL